MAKLKKPRCLSRVLDINPKHTGALLNLGNRRLDEARRKELSGQRRKTKIEEAIGFACSRSNMLRLLAYSQLGTALQMSGDMASSMKALEEAVNSTLLLQMLGSSWLSNNQAGNWEVARDAYRRVIGLDPTRVMRISTLESEPKKMEKQCLQLKRSKMLLNLIYAS